MHLLLSDHESNNLPGKLENTVIQGI